MSTITAEIAKALGAKEWFAGQHHRFYFDGLHELVGLKCERYKSGGIKAATLKGEEISNNKAFKISLTLSTGKCWLDAKTGELHTKDLDNYAAEVVSAIHARASEIAKPAKTRKSRKEVMIRAWAIARAAVARFGGKVRVFFAESLKLAWAE